MTDAHVLLAVALAFLLAGLAKGVLGLGLPTVAIGLLGLFLPPATAAALLLVPSLVTNLWQALAGPGLAPLLRRLWPMMAGICAGTWAGAALGADALTGAGAAGASAALGAALALYGALGLSGARLAAPARAEPWLSPAMGALTGAATGATGVFAIPAVPYLQSLGLGRDELVQALGLSFTVSTVALAASLARGGAIEPALATGSALALAPALLGMALGARLRARIRAEAFRRWFFLALLALGGHLALRPFL